jgi:hypothetical protein
VEPSAAGLAPPPLTDFSPQALPWRRGQLAEPKLVDRLARGMCAHRPNVVHGTHARASAVTQRDTTVILRGQGRRHPEAACMTHSNCRPSKHRAIFSCTPPRSFAMSPPSTPPVTRQPNLPCPKQKGGDPEQWQGGFV